MPQNYTSLDQIATREPTVAEITGPLPPKLPSLRSGAGQTPREGNYYRVVWTNGFIEEYYFDPDNPLFTSDPQLLKGKTWTEVHNSGLGTSQQATNQTGNPETDQSLRKSWNDETVALEKEFNQRQAASRPDQNPSNHLVALESGPHKTPDNPTGKGTYYLTPYQVPDVGADGKPIIGADGKPQTHTEIDPVLVSTDYLAGTTATIHRNEAEALKALAEAGAIPATTRLREAETGRTNAQTNEILTGNIPLLNAQATEALARAAKTDVERQRLESDLKNVLIQRDPAALAKWVDANKDLFIAAGVDPTEFYQQAFSTLTQTMATGRTPQEIAAEQQTRQTQNYTTANQTATTVRNQDIGMQQHAMTLEAGRQKDYATQVGGLGKEMASLGEAGAFLPGGKSNATDYATARLAFIDSIFGKVFSAQPAPPSAAENFINSSLNQAPTSLQQSTPQTRAHTPDSVATPDNVIAGAANSDSGYGVTPETQAAIDAAQSPDEVNSIIAKDYSAFTRRGGRNAMMPEPAGMA